jgi:hypothetical protein
MAGHDPETVLNKPVGVRAFLFAAALKQAEEEQNSPAENSGMEGR